jgi:nucleotide-binding universal stress UspA family protein
MVGSVLVGVDGSDDSRIALMWAAGAARELGLGLRVMQAWQYPASAVVEVGRLELPDPEKVDSMVEDLVQQFVDDVLGPEQSDVSVEVGRGGPALALMHAAQQPTDMIVVGSRGLGGFASLVLGSVSRQLLEHASTPVVVVPRPTPVYPMRLSRVVVGLDGSEQAAHALRWATRLADASGADMVGVHAIESEAATHPPGIEPLPDPDRRAELLEEWCEPARTAGASIETALLVGDPREALLDVAHEHGADLLVVGSHGQGPVARLLVGSTATGVTQRADLPVAVVPPTRWSAQAETDEAGGTSG